VKQEWKKAGLDSFVLRMESKHSRNQTVIYTSPFGWCFLYGGWKKLTIDSGIPNISTPLDSLLEKFKIGHAVESSQATKKVVTILVFFHIKNQFVPHQKQSVRSLLKICQSMSMIYGTSTLQHVYSPNIHQRKLQLQANRLQV